MKKDHEKLSYPIDEAFEVIGVNRSMGYRLIADGKLESFRLGKRRYATREALKKCVDALARDSQGKAA